MHWIVALVVAALVLGVVAIAMRQRSAREEAKAGLAVLSSMRWRDFANLVLEAMQKRGYRRLRDPEAAGEESNFLLERDGMRWLLGCKHGSAYALGLPAVSELASAMRVQGVDGGLLVTQGTIADDARAVAARERIELLDGQQLWPELRMLLPDARRAEIGAEVARHRSKALLAGSVAAIGAAAATFVLLRPAATPEAPAPEPRPPVAATQPPASTPPVAAADAGIDIGQQRKRVAEAVSTLPGVDRAIWTSQSTLQVFLGSVPADAKAQLCPLLEAYPQLAASRIQLTPPPGSDAPTRFIQCRAF